MVFGFWLLGLGASGLEFRGYLVALGTIEFRVSGLRNPSFWYLVPDGFRVRCFGFGSGVSGVAFELPGLRV